MSDLCQRRFGMFGTSRCQRLCITTKCLFTACSRHLQQKVANHLKAVPKGMVFLSHMSQLSPVLLRVLFNGMSEHDSLQRRVAWPPSHSYVRQVNGGVVPQQAPSAQWELLMAVGAGAQWYGLLPLLSMQGPHSS
jgi:hypothetical protein